MDSIEYLGLVASSLATLAFLPQVVKTWRTGSANDFSLTTLLMIEAGTSIWIFYGLLRSAPAIWLGNGVTFALIGLILSVKIKNLLFYNQNAQFLDCQVTALEAGGGVWTITAAQVRRLRGS